jgi:hypothetical protein
MSSDTFFNEFKEEMDDRLDVLEVELPLLLEKIKR